MSQQNLREFCVPNEEKLRSKSPQERGPLGPIERTRDEPREAAARLCRHVPHALAYGFAS